MSGCGQHGFVKSLSGVVCLREASAAVRDGDCAEIGPVRESTGGREIVSAVGAAKGQRQCAIGVAIDAQSSRQVFPGETDVPHRIAAAINGDVINCVGNRIEAQDARATAAAVIVARDSRKLADAVAGVNGKRRVEVAPHRAPFHAPGAQGSPAIPH